MADKQQRQISRRRLYLAVEAVVDSTPGMTGDNTIDELLDAIKDEWFKDAK